MRDVHQYSRRSVQKDKTREERRGGGERSAEGCDGKEGGRARSRSRMEPRACEARDRAGGSRMRARFVPRWVPPCGPRTTMMDCASTFNTPGRPRIALGTARTWSSLSSSGVSILIRLRRLLEGESRVPPPLEAARASIVLLSLRTRAGENAHRERPRFRVFGNGSSGLKGTVGRR